jgi:hypothetical protein
LRGAAMVEAVILVPTLLLLLLAVLHIHRSRSAVLHAASRARSCAFEYAVHGCKTVPEGCERIVASSSSTKDVELGKRADRDAEEAEPGIMGVIGRIVPSMKSISTFPILGDAIGRFFGARGRATVEVEFQAHLPEDHGSYTASSGFVVACNTRRSDGEDVADDLFKVFHGVF